MSIFGYTRVSTSNQDYQTQIQKLQTAGAEKIFSEKYTGIKKRRQKRINKFVVNCKNWGPGSRYQN